MTGAILVACSILLQAQTAPPRDAEPRAGTGSIAGRVTAAGTGQPLPRMVVSLARPAAAPEREVLTDAEGRYRFDGVPDGPYVVTARPDDHRSTYLAQRFGEQDPASLFETSLRPGLSLGPGEARSNVDIAVSRALAITGRVLDPWDEPMAGVDVVVTRADGGSVFTLPAQTDDLGAYRLYGLARGRYRVCAAAPDNALDQSGDGGRFVRTCHPSAVVEGQAGDVVVQATDVEGMDIHVQRLGTFTLSGTIVDAAGAAVNGASVVVSSDHLWGPSSSARSQDGQFVVPGLLPGRYLVTASVGGRRAGDPNPASREREMGFAWAEVAGGDATSVTLALSRPASIAGVVVFDGADAPAPERLRMVVQVRPTDRAAARTLGWTAGAAVDDDLRFELKDVYRLPTLLGVQQLPDGWVVSAVRYGGRDVTHVPTDFAGTPGGRLEIVLTNRVARPSVRVRDESGSPVASARVVVFPAEPGASPAPLPIAPAAPDAEGIVTLGPMRPGAYRIAALSTADFQLVTRDTSRFLALVPLGTPVTFVEGDERVVDLMLVPLPPR
jgi:hypothetical protein